MLSGNRQGFCRFKIMAAFCNAEGERPLSLADKLANSGGDFFSEALAIEDAKMSDFSLYVVGMQRGIETELVGRFGLAWGGDVVFSTFDGHQRCFIN